MSRRSFPLLVLLLLAAALLATGCGGGGDSGGSDSGSEDSAASDKELPEGTIGVELGEFFVKPSSDSVAAGEVTFQVENVGSASHELVVYRTDEAADALPQADGMAKLDESKVIDETDELSSGDSAELSVELEAGKYLLLCNLPGHYQSGQVIEFEVT